MYLELGIPVRLMPDELFGAFLHNFRSIYWSDRHFRTEKQVPGVKVLDKNLFKN